ncbi:MAG TPA: hypothetical protein EYP56_03095 [Planctomycetaceae bacterium]|nr:hypothetical protein [Planctomycetaceae bacterium]
MKFKLDENLDIRLGALLAAEGHEVDSAVSEGLSGSSDDAVYRACRESGRALVTLDLDFFNPFRFPPAPTEGIVVVRPPRPVLPVIRTVLLSVLPEFKRASLKGQLWIAEPGRVRVYKPGED